MSILRRHFHSILLLIVTSVLVGVVGFTVTTTKAQGEFDPVLNPIPMFLWRCIFYLSIVSLWGSVIKWRVNKKASANIACVINRSRKILVISIVLFELLIVQNVFWSVVIGLWSLFYGR